MRSAVVNKGEKTIFSFGPYRLDPQERVLSRADEPVGLTPKAFDALVLLVENSGHLLDKHTLVQQLWPDTVVEDNNLSQCIYVLRRTLNEPTSSTDDEYI
jgi:DNA-binding winged helix-turn-helix (wHTH) protein